MAVKGEGQDSSSKPPVAKKPRRKSPVIKDNDLFEEDVVVVEETNYKDKPVVDFGDEGNFNGGGGDDSVISIASDENSDISKTVDKLLGSDFRTKSELTNDEIKALTILIGVGRRWKSLPLLRASEDFLALRCSLARGSRKEVVAAFGAIEQMSRAQAMRESPLDRFRGMR